MKYLLKNSTDNSRTWSIFIRQLSIKYGLSDPLTCLNSDPPEKSVYKEHILTKITSFYERELRENSLSNSCMSFLNVSVTGLRGRHHPALSNQLTTFDVSKSRPHLKMLCQDYLTYEKRADQSGGSPHCRCCNPGIDQLRPSESLFHILAESEQYSEVRDRIFPEMEYLCSRSNIDFGN